MNGPVLTGGLFDPISNGEAEQPIGASPVSRAEISAVDVIFHLLSRTDGTEFLLILLLNLKLSLHKQDKFGVSEIAYSY